MNNKRIHEYIEKLRKISLSSETRLTMRKNLESYADFHPITEDVRVEADNRSIERVPERTQYISRLFNIKFTTMTAALLVALLIGGGTSYAAEGAVPGDLLYPIKVEINENIRSAFAVTNKEEAELQAVLAEERLTEAEELAARGELTGEVSTDIRARVEAHYNDASERSNKAEADGDFETSAAVRASLQGMFTTHADILTRIDAQVGNDNSASLVSDLREYITTTEHAQATATADIGSSARVDVENIVVRSGILVKTAGEKLADMKSDISARAYAQVEAQYGEALRAQANAEASLRTQMYQEAYAYAQTAIRIAKEIEATLVGILNINLDLDLDVMTDGLIDTKVDSSTETNAESRSNDTSSPDDADVDVDASVDVDTTIDTGIIDAEVQTDAVLKSNTNLGL